MPRSLLRLGKNLNNSCGWVSCPARVSNGVDYKKMRIAIDSRAIFKKERTGKGEYSFEILKNLLKIDSRNQYFLYCQKKAKLPWKVRPDVQVRCFALPGFLWHFFVWLDLKLRLKPDVYFTPESYIVPALGVRNSVLIVPDLIAFLFPYKHNQKAVFLEKIFLGRALRKAKKVGVISQATRRDLLQIFKIDPQKVKLIYPGVERKFYQVGFSPTLQEKVRRRYHLLRKFILFVGTLEPRKNLVTLVRAYKKLSFPSYDLVIAGGKGWHYRDIFQEVERLNLEDKVHFLGYVPKEYLPPLYHLAEVFVFPSLYEGFGLPPLEAMACGTPVITSNTSSLPEVVGRAALLIDPRNVNELMTALKKVLTDKDLRDKLVRLGLERVKQFNWQKTAREVLKILEEVTYTT